MTAPKELFRESIWGTVHDSKEEAVVGSFDAIKNELEDALSILPFDSNEVKERTQQMLNYLNNESYYVVRYTPNKK